MKHLLKVLLALLLIPAGQQIGVYAQNAKAQKPKKSPKIAQTASDNDSLNSKDLQLEVSASKKDFLPLEPILLTIKLNTISGQPLVAKEQGIKAQPSLAVRLKKEQRVLDAGAIEAALAAVPGGQSEVKFKFLLVEGLKDFLINPGRYQIHLELDLGSKRPALLQAQPLEIQVVEPHGIDKEAFDFINSVVALNNFMQGAGGSESADIDSALRGFVTHFRTSGYGDYFAFQLAANCFQRGELSGAKGLLQDLAIKSDFGYAEDVVGMMALISAQLGQRNLLEGYLQRLRSEFPKSPYIEKLTEMLNGEK